MPLIGAYANAMEAVASLAGAAADRRAAVLPHAAAHDAARRQLREASIECITTLAGEDLSGAEWLCRELAQAQGWHRGAAEGEAPGRASPGDVIGWYEVRVAYGGSLITTDRPITRLHGGRAYIASFNLLGQGRLNRALGDVLHRRLADDGIVPGVAFDVVVCAESKAVGMAQALVERFGLDRYVVFRKGLKNYMPRHPRPPLEQEVASITTAGTQSLVLDPNDWPLVEGRRALLVDDVIATGGTVRAACALLGRAGAEVAAVAAILLKGPEPDVPRLIVLARPLL
ncbi:MAG TPA: phosphoribosyltransferase family protein [Candidatus Sulfotelmatobacter sp.]|nr:phosphoribosyltransferase family protein [Candidatus Sulfotelmatobacter sp.]